MSIPPYNPNPEYQQIPGDTQAISMGNGYGVQSHNPKSIPAIKKLNSIMWASAAAYGLILLIQLTRNIVSIGDVSITGSYAGVSSLVLTIGSIVGLLLAAVLYFLVYSLISRGKNEGRITGTVFAAVSILTGLPTGVLGIIFAPLSSILYIIWAVLGIVWIIFAYKSDVTAALR